MSVLERVLPLVAEVAEADEVLQNPDLELYRLGLLDSLATVELMVSLENAFGIELSPTEFSRETWATPRKIAGYIESRLGGGGAGGGSAAGGGAGESNKAGGAA